MFTWQRLTNCLLFALLLCVIASAQEERRPATKPQPADVPITVAAAGERVRFTAIGAIERMRLEVFDASGSTVFDTGFLPGSVRDWRLADSHGRPLPDGSYTCAVTVRELTGRLSLKQGGILVQDGLASTALDGGGQTAAIEPEQALTTRASEPGAMTVIAHDGADGQVTSTEGALTFRTGDLFTGRDKEQVRITPEGKVGIGTKDPRAALDVAGAIRASEGIAFADGSVLTSAGASKGAPSEGIEPAVSGTGTTGRLTKWTDGATGALGDSVVTELSGRIGVATSTPRARLDIKQSADSFVGGLHLRRAATDDTWALVTGADNKLYVGYANSASGADAGGDFTVYPLVLTPTNSVGVGTTAPAAKLHVSGDVNFTGLRTEITASTPNVVGGLSGNSVTEGVIAATIGGGGRSGEPNRVTDSYGTVGGGQRNAAGNGGLDGGTHATVAGGHFNAASGGEATVGGGFSNRATGTTSTIGGGYRNEASDIYATVGGGQSNVASGLESTVPGGGFNTALGNNSFAAGRGAQALHNGSFVWADTADDGVASTADNQFLIRAWGGVGINTNSPRATLGLVGSTGNANFFMRSAATTTRGINFGVDGSAPNARLFIAQYNGTTYQDRLVINADGTVSVNVLAAATGTHLCVNGTKLANCSSSLRYKERVAPFDAGLGLLGRLRPVTFKWKGREELDLGLIAEEVNQVEPLLVTRDSAGEVQGVKYDQLSIVLINALREQQRHIEELRARLSRVERTTQKRRAGRRRY